ncbi:hypothetical protein [Glutamicibacter sp.]|uniref:hypothetical protein n=1 Tax=Glutamicibacter sp. TaxID=1931995 RepID=UPI0028BF359B|nr:hypothetical protein [Glutamicibacter sp.]
METGDKQQFQQAENTLGRFFLRARRIAAHSLAVDHSELEALANPKLSGTLGNDGSIEIRRQLPDEEIFESLASRLRPLLLKTESIHYAKVLEAIETVIKRCEQASTYSDALLGKYACLRNDWGQFDEAKPIALRYSTQMAKKDGSDSTPEVSDSQLALAWLYGDLVHVDVRGQKKSGTHLPIKERFLGAVSYFSSVAILCARTMEFVSELADLGAFELSEETTSTAVVVGTNEIVETGTAYFAPVGTEMPKMNVLDQQFPVGFKQLTVTEMLRTDDRNQVQLQIESSDGSLVAEYEAAVTHRESQGERMEWHVLVAGCVEYRFTCRIQDNVASDLQLEIKVLTLTTNRMFLDKYLFERACNQGSLLRFRVLERDFIALEMGNTSDQNIQELDFNIGIFQDLITIENITSEHLSVPIDPVAIREVVELRQTRLLWEGNVVPLRCGALKITIRAGETPQAVIAPEGTRTIGGTSYPTPQFLVTHPLMKPTTVESIPHTDPPQNSITMSIPVAEPFIGWVPEKKNIAGVSDLQRPVSLDFPHLDLTYLFGTWKIEDGISIS